MRNATGLSGGGGGGDGCRGQLEPGKAANVSAQLGSRQVESTQPRMTVLANTRLRPEGAYMGWRQAAPPRQLTHFAVS